MSRFKQSRPFTRLSALAGQQQPDRKGSLQQKANKAAACNAEGNAAFGQSSFEQAKSSYLLAVAYDPGYTDAHFNLGNVHYAQQDYVSALASYSRALETSTPQADLYTSMGVTYFALNDIISAKEYLLKAIELDASFPDAFYNLGTVLRKEREYVLALRCFKSAVALRPEYVQAHQNLGATQQQLGDLNAAVESYLQALRLTPNNPVILNNLADALTLQGRPEGPALFARLIAEQPSSADAHWNASTAFLLQGDYIRGWQEYEWRWQSKGFTSVKRDFPCPAWGGEPLEGSSILIHAEQGFGDTLQFVRYLPLLAEQGGRVFLQVPAALKRLLSTCPGVVKTLSDDEPLPDVDYHCALMSLPLFFKTTLETIPPPIRLHVEDTSSSLTNDRTVRVGLVWAGNPEHQYDHLRSLSLAHFLPLTKVDGVHFISLQKGPAAIETTQVSFPGGILNACAEARDFLDTARVVEGLDLVIAVDTAVAHLAASMGKPVWLLLRNLPEWRWGLSSDTSPWYPTVKLFRKPFGTDWQTFMTVVSSQLATLVANP